MQNLFILLILVCLQGTYCMKYFSEDELYRTLSTTLSSFRIPSETLVQSITDLENNNDSDQETGNKLKLGCVTYRKGAIFARNYNGIVHPFYVSKSNDLMCFLIEDENENGSNNPNSNAPLGQEFIEPMSASLDTIVPIPSTSKVEDSFFDFIEAGLEFETFQDRINFLQLNGSVELAIDYYDFKKDRISVIPDSLVKAIQDLPQYDMRNFNSFFSFNVTNDAEYYEEDKQAWVYFRNVLQKQLDDDIVDPCKVKDISVRQLDHALLFKFDDLLNMKDGLAEACTAYIVASVSPQPWVSSLFLYTSPELLNANARGALQCGKASEKKEDSPYSAIGLSGKNEIVAVVDTGLDEMSCWFIDDNGDTAARSKVKDPDTNEDLRKIIQYASVDNADEFDADGGHGTHVAGTVAGNNGDDLFGDGKGKHAGIAPDAKLTIMDLSVPGSGIFVPSTYELFAAGYNAGARIQTMSWGSKLSNMQYYFNSMDDFMYKHQDFVILFAAGNYGADNVGKTTITRQANLKNAVSVGATESGDIGNIAYFSSMGPAYDGRIKPEIVAPGYFLDSAKSSGKPVGDGKETCEVMGMAGTSMATPAVAGAAALIRQYFRDDKFWSKTCNKDYDNCKKFRPSGVLIKALLLHSGQPMSTYKGINSGDDMNLGMPPDNVQGYGRVQLTNVLPVPGESSDFDLFILDKETIEDGEEILIIVDLPDSAPPLKVTLVWYDPAPDGKPSKALIHDLDLIVQSSEGKKYGGNGERDGDEVNVNEQVYVQSPPKGAWKVTVKADALPVSGKQKFSLVITSGGTCSVQGRSSSLLKSLPPTMPPRMPHNIVMKEEKKNNNEKD